MTPTDTIFSISLQLARLLAPRLLLLPTPDAIDTLALQLSLKLTRLLKASEQRLQAGQPLTRAHLQDGAHGWLIHLAGQYGRQNYPALAASREELLQALRYAHQLEGLVDHPPANNGSGWLAWMGEELVERMN